LDAKLLIVDEPTAALGVSQTTLVLNLIRQLADQGIGVIMISHNLTDVFKVADWIAILYLGRLVTVGPASDFDTATAVHWMTAGTAPDGPDCTTRRPAARTAAHWPAAR